LFFFFPLLFFFFFFLFFFFFFFFFNDTATTEIYTLSLHDALPICPTCPAWPSPSTTRWSPQTDRKSTRLNSSHITISYAVFCLKKKKKKITEQSIKTSNRDKKIYHNNTKKT